jgi:hypothetical protein
MELNVYQSIATFQSAVSYSILTLEPFHYTWRCGVQRVCFVSGFRVQWKAEVRDFFPYDKTTRWTNFSSLFWNETLHVSDSSSVHHQELFTIHSVMVYVIQLCRQLSSSSRIKLELQFHPDPDAARKLSTNMWDNND